MFDIVIPNPKGAICDGCFKQSSKIVVVSMQLGMEMYPEGTCIIKA